MKARCPKHGDTCRGFYKDDHDQVVPWCYVCHGYALVAAGWEPLHLLTGEQLDDARWAAIATGRQQQLGEREAV